MGLPDAYTAHMTKKSKPKGHWKVKDNVIKDAKKYESKLSWSKRSSTAYQSHYYRQWWYWGGEANLRVNGTKLQLTTIPDEEWATVETAAQEFWEEIAAESETKRRVVDIFKKYNADMVKAGRPYRYG